MRIAKRQPTPILIIMAWVAAFMSLPAYSQPAPPVSGNAEFKDEFFDSDGVRLHYIDVGQGAPVVLLHGFSSSMSEWVDTGMVKALSREFRVIAIDCRGHGKSDKPSGSSSYGAEMMEDVHRLLDHLHIQKSFISGYSMGGWIAGKLLVKYPERVLGVVFGGVAPNSSPMVPADRLPTLSEMPPPMREAFTKGKDEQTIAAMAAYLESSSELYLTTAEIGRIKEIKVPLLTIIGSLDDHMYRVDAFAKIRPDMKVVVIEGATHAYPKPAQSYPQFVAALREFLISNQPRDNR
jgi:pimeloyl-ACP methyl ester carboxylesterase